MSNGTPGQSGSSNIGGGNSIGDQQQQPPTAGNGHKKTNSLGPLASLNGSGIKYVKP